MFHRKNFDDIADVIQFIKAQPQGSDALHGYRLMHKKNREHANNPEARTGFTQSLVNGDRAIIPTQALPGSVALE